MARWLKSRDDFKNDPEPGTPRTPRPVPPVGGSSFSPSEDPSWEGRSEELQSPTAEEVLRKLHTKSRALHVDLQGLLPQFMEDLELRVFAGTWNLAGRPPPSKKLSLDEWLDVQNPADIYVIGFQEIVPLNIYNVVLVEDGSAVTAWENLIRRTLNKPTGSQGEGSVVSNGSNRTRSNSPSLEEVHAGKEPTQLTLPENAGAPDLRSALKAGESEGQSSMPREFVDAEDGAGATEMDDGEVEDGDSEDLKQKHQQCLRRSMSESTLLEITGTSAVTGGVQQLSPESSAAVTTSQSRPLSPVTNGLGHGLTAASSSPIRSWTDIAGQVQNNFSALVRGWHSTKVTKAEEQALLRQRPEEEDDAVEEETRSSTCLSPESTSSSSGQGRYTRKASKQMAGVHLSIWVRSDLSRDIHHIKACEIQTGFFNMLANKGGVCISMTVHGTPMCFICSHLSSGDKPGDEAVRNKNVAQILQKARFPRSDDLMVLPETILEHDMCIWVGDLNYRLNMDDDQVRQHIVNGNFAPMLEADQLNIERRAGNVFRGWDEGEVTFPPTFKYIIGTTRYVGEIDPSEMEEKDRVRTPAWCDRILWRGGNIRLLSYERTELAASDHRPVKAAFSVVVDTVGLSKGHEAIHAERQRLDAADREQRPQCTLSPHQLAFGELWYGTTITGVAQLHNVGKVPARWVATIAHSSKSPSSKWLSLECEAGTVAEGETFDIVLRARVDTTTVKVEEVLARSGMLDSVLIVRLDGGGDLYVSCNAKYITSAWGLRLERLAELDRPARLACEDEGGPPPYEESTSPRLAGEEVLGTSARGGPQQPENSNRTHSSSSSSSNWPSAAPRPPPSSSAPREGEEEKGTKLAKVTHHVPKEILTLVNYLNREAVMNTPMLLEPRKLLMTSSPWPAAGQLQQSSHASAGKLQGPEAVAAEVEWSDVQLQLEERIARVRECIDTGRELPEDMPGPLVGAALLSLIQAAPEGVIPRKLVEHWESDPQLWKKGSNNNNSGSGSGSSGSNKKFLGEMKERLPAVHVSVLELVLDLVLSLLEHSDKNLLTEDRAVVALSHVLFGMESVNEQMKKRHWDVVRQLLKERQAVTRSG